jgi:hypothetical protein
MPSRNTTVFGAIALVILSLTGSTVVALYAWNQIHERADRLAAIGDAMAAATLLLSALAATIALVAYLSSTSAPRLEAELVFRCSEPNRPVFLVEDDPLSGRPRLVSFRQLEASVRIHNRRATSAHNPAMRIDLVGMGGIRAQRGWRPVDWANPYGVCAVQWDGGTQYAIHGNGTRVLPSLTLHGVHAMPDEPVHAMRVTVVADGFGKGWTMPVELRRRDAYLQYSLERAQRHVHDLALVETCGLPDCDRQASMRVLLFPTNANPLDTSVCADCADTNEAFLSMPALMIVDNLDFRPDRHDVTGRHVIGQSRTRSGSGEM